MVLSWSSKSWNDYLWWQRHDRSTVKKINALLKEIMRTPYEGSGKPEPLKYEYSGLWSRRITKEHRLVYRYDEGQIQVVSCRFHY